MMKTNKLITLLLTLAMLVSMSSFAVFADDETGRDTNETSEITHVKDFSPATGLGIVIGGKYVDQPGDYGPGNIGTIKSGSVYYDGSGTLTLKGVTIEGPQPGEGWCGIEAYGMDLTIILEGTNSITSKYRGIGLVGDNCSLNIKGNDKGNGTLTIEALYTGIYFNGNNGLTISDKATVNSKSTYH